MTTLRLALIYLVFVIARQVRHDLANLVSWARTPAPSTRDAS